MERDSFFRRPRLPHPRRRIELGAIRHCRECPSGALRAVLRRYNRYIAVVVGLCEYDAVKRKSSPHTASGESRWILSAPSARRFLSTRCRHHVQSSPIWAPDSSSLGVLSSKVAVVGRPQKNAVIVFLERRKIWESQNQRIRYRVLIAAVASARRSPMLPGQSGRL